MLTYALCFAAMGAALNAGPKALVSPETSATAELTVRFDNSGWGSEDAAALAVYVIKVHKGLAPAPFEQAEAFDEGVEAPPIGPDVPALMLMKDVFIASGWGLDAALAHAATSLDAVQFGEPDPAMLDAYRVYYVIDVVVCDELGNRTRYRKNIQDGCWDDVIDCWNNNPLAPQCFNDQRKGFALETACWGGGCVWVAERSGPHLVACNDLTVEACSCIFDQLGQDPCSAIKDYKCFNQSVIQLPRPERE